MKLYPLISIFLLLALWSCTATDPIMDFNEVDVQDSQIVEPEPDSVIVNSYELNRVFAQYGPVNARNYNVQTIYDIQGKPALFVMNYGEDNGFVVVSATKDCPPIMAYNDHGSFDIDSEIMPLRDWALKNAEIVNNANNYIPTDTILNFRKLWSEYENHPIKERAKSRYSGHLSIQQYSRLEQIYREFMFSPHAKGFQIYSLGEYLREHPEKDYLLNIATNIIYPDYQEDVLDLTFIGLKTEVLNERENLVKAEWGQDKMFNYSFPPVGNIPNAFVGCTAVAAGQIMHYYKYPEYYDWSDMPEKDGSITTSNFLYDIVKDSNPIYFTYGTAISFKDMTRVLQSRGYNAECISTDKIEGTIPFMVDTEMLSENNQKKQHAWIVSGSGIFQSEDFMEMWTFTEEYDFTVPYGENYGPTYGYRSYYINWGYHGQSNGYYLDLYHAYPAHRFEDSPYKSTKVKNIITNIRPKTKTL